MGRFAWILGFCCSLGAAGCASEPDYCRFDPGECGGGIGGDCVFDEDCQDGFCCREDSNCGGGMCTYACRSDADCPASMRCQHDICFFSCSIDDDCASGQRCEHDNTICEWP